jgi:hypothetical protein
VLYLVGNCINLYQFGEGFLLVTSDAFLGSQSIDGDATQTSSTSIYDIILTIGGHFTAKSTLRS